MAEDSDSARRYRRAFWWLLGAFFLFRLWFSTTLPLSGDEAYHWEWSRHPAFGYYDHPGLTAYLILGATALLRRSTELSVRLPALAMLTGTAAVSFLLARRLAAGRGGTAAEAARAGFMAGLLVLATPIFAVFSVYISTDPPLIFFWTLALYLFCRAVDGGAWGDWLGAGLAVGLAVMSKFLGLLLLPAFAVFGILSKTDRAWLRRPQPYAAAAVAGLVTVPFLWWNATHGWATFVFNFVERQREVDFTPRYVPEFIAGQALAVSPLIFGLALFALWRGWRAWKSEGDRGLLIVGLSTWFPLAYFCYVSFRRRVGLHWPAAGWIGALACVACCWAVPGPARRGWNRWMAAGLSACLVMTVGLHLLVHVPPGWLQREWRYGASPSRIGTHKHVERFGWRELGVRVQAAHDELLAAQAGGEGGAPGVFIICSEYGLAADVAFYTPRQMHTHLWSARRTHGENYRFWDRFEEYGGMDAVYVAKRESTALGMLPRLKEHFREVGTPERIPIVVDGRELRAFYLVRCRGFDGRPPVFDG